MAKPTIASTRGLGDFQKTYTWELSAIRLPSIAPINSEVLNSRCMSTDLPGRDNQVATVMMRGNQVFDPGISTVRGTLNLTFLETVNAEMRDWMIQWEEEIAEKRVPFTSLYGDFRITQLDNQWNRRRYYDLKFCFLQSSNFNQLGGDDSNPMQPSMTLQYMDYTYGRV